MHTVYLSLGSNEGDRRGLLTRAIEEIGRLVGTVECQSAFYETEPWGFESAHLFLNACVRVATELTPRELLETTQQIERSLGRRRKSRRSFLLSLASKRYADRPIDIDILLYDDVTVDEPDLKIPHPLMYERDFVMIPLKEILDR